jgi:hypothetical protein
LRGRSFITKVWRFIVSSACCSFTAPLDLDVEYLEPHGTGICPISYASGPLPSTLRAGTRLTSRKKWCFDILNLRIVLEKLAKPCFALGRCPAPDFIKIDYIALGFT